MLYRGIACAWQSGVWESYFRPRRIKGAGGRGTRGKIIVFGLVKRHCSEYTENDLTIQNARLRE